MGPSRADEIESLWTLIVTRPDLRSQVAGVGANWVSLESLKPLIGLDPDLKFAGCLKDADEDW